MTAQQTVVGHTPGPWRVQVTTYSGDNFPSFGVKSADDKRWVVLPTAHEANARLIAAAPDLLAALRQLCDEFELSAAVDDETTTPYRALIANAEGRS